MEEDVLPSSSSDVLSLFQFGRRLEGGRAGGLEDDKAEGSMLQEKQQQEYQQVNKERLEPLMTDAWCQCCCLCCLCRCVMSVLLS